MHEQHCVSRTQYCSPCCSSQVTGGRDLLWAGRGWWGSCSWSVGLLSSPWLSHWEDDSESFGYVLERIVRIFVTARFLAIRQFHLRARQVLVGNAAQDVA